MAQVSGAHRLEVRALCVDPLARFAATAGDDGLVKVWGLVPRDAPRSQLQDGVPPHQAFGGHSSVVHGELLWGGRCGASEGRGVGAGESSALLSPAGHAPQPCRLPCAIVRPAGIAVKGNYLITVGDADSVLIWHINCPVPPGGYAHLAGGSRRAAPATAATRQFHPAEPATTLASGGRRAGAIAAPQPRVTARGAAAGALPRSGAATAGGGATAASPRSKVRHFVHRWMVDGGCSALLQSCNVSVHASPKRMRRCVRAWPR